jgi:hypothetical protein
MESRVCSCGHCDHHLSSRQDYGKYTGSNEGELSISSCNVNDKKITNDMCQLLQLEFIKEIGFTHMRILEGVSTVIQLGGLLARLCKMVSAQFTQGSFCTTSNDVSMHSYLLPATGAKAVYCTNRVRVCILPTPHVLLLCIPITTYLVMTQFSYKIYPHSNLSSLDLALTLSSSSFPTLPVDASFLPFEWRVKIGRALGVGCLHFLFGPPSLSCPSSTFPYFLPLPLSSLDAGTRQKGCISK